MRWVLTVGAALLAVAGMPADAPLDKDARKWVDQTLRGFTVEQLAGQMVFASLDSTYLPTDSDKYDELSRLVRDTQVGGLIAFGGAEPVPQVLLNNTYGPIILGQPLELATMLNRLQALARVPLLASADFEWGAGMRIGGATKFPRAMAFGAAGDAALATEAARVTATESRAMGVHVDFGPVADVNNNARNPVINIRSFGEDPARVAPLVGAWVRGLQEGGMLATLKHFPGHGDTDVDSHLGLPIVTHARDRLDAVELPPFKAGIAAGAAAVMVAHIEMPSIDEDAGPATFSGKIVQGLLRTDLGFKGLVVTDSMKMAGVTALAPPGEAAVKAVKAGVDVILDSPDPASAVTAIAAAVRSGDITRVRVEASVRKLLEAKAGLGLHRTRLVPIDAIAQQVGGRARDAVAAKVAERALTLVKDERNEVPLKLPSGGHVLYISALDYPSGWRTAAPSRTMIPEIKARWPATEAVEVSDRTTPNELDLMREMASRADAVIAGVFVRAASASGRLDLSAPVAKLLEDIARAQARRNAPMVAVFHGNPYATLSTPSLPAMLLTYDFSDASERASIRALAGEIPIGGKLPVALPGLFPLGHGLTRAQPLGVSPR